MTLFLIRRLLLFANPVLSTLQFKTVTRYSYVACHYFLILQLIVLSVLFIGLVSKIHKVILGSKCLFTLNTTVCWLVLTVSAWFLLTVELNRRTFASYTEHKLGIYECGKIWSDLEGMKDQDEYAKRLERCDVQKVGGNGGVKGQTRPKIVNVAHLNLPILPPR